MAKKSSYHQGYIKEIYELFFRPLVKRYRRPGASIKEFLEDLFDVDYRHIYRVKARNKFDIPGLLYTAGWAKVQGIGYRTVNKGTLLVVREDMRNPNTVDVEFNGGVGEKEHVYQLTRTEFNSIAVQLEKLDK